MDFKSLDKDISFYSSEALCSMVASLRYLKIRSDLQKICLLELKKRELAGDYINFEDKIKEFMNSFPNYEKNSIKMEDIIKTVKKGYSI